ncbi:MAG: penicillin-binding protein 2 [Chloroflexia bacterium]|nr:penicillin-binding protein 2 [Chloroflexia bacterium]
MSQLANNPVNHRLPVNRIAVLLVIFALFIILIAYRVVMIQVVRSAEFGDQAIAERFQENSIPASRGDILDSNGVRLATNVPADRISAIVSLIEDKHDMAVKLSPLIGRPVEEIESALSQEGVEWVLLARRLSPEASASIAAMDLEGIVLDPEPRRVYPSDTFASHVLGFANYDHEGSYGIEGAYDTEVGGTSGRVIGERDGAGNVIALSQNTWDPPTDGSDLVLTIDSAVQRIVESVLADTIEKQDAAGGTIIVQDPNTGAILGMASWPTFDPNNFDEVNDISIFSNPAVSSVYEPGSTFKSIVMAIGIDDGVVTPDTIHNDAPGYIEVPGHSPITNNNGRVWGEETMTQVLEHSANLGAVFVAERIGQERFYQRLMEFGMGRETGIDLQGEERGILTGPWEPDWNPTLFYTNAFGQGIAVTPVQLINAVSAVINGGKLMQPYVVSEVRGEGEAVVHDPTMIRQVMSPESSQTLREMLRSVVVNGAGVFADVPGYAIGAKSGTAQIPSPEGGYIDEATIASMVGFGPVVNPQFTVLVKIDWPKESPWGETVAGPALADVFNQLFKLYGIPPTEAE